MTDFLGTINIEYNRTMNHASSPTRCVVQRDLPALFSIIATEMMDVAIVESSVEYALRVGLFKDNSYQCSFVDRQLIKKLLNQFKELNLVYSSWSDSTSKLYWGLTAKGKRVRNEMILAKNPSQIVK